MQREAVERRVAARRSRFSSAKTRSRRDALEPGRLRPARPRRSPASTAKPELGRPAARAAACAAGPPRTPPRATIRSRRAARSSRAAVGIDELAARQRLGHRVDGEVARREVGRERAALQRRDVDLPRLPGADDAPAAERVGELERALRPPRARMRRAATRGSSVDDEVEVVVGARAAEQAVAHRAADDPRRAASPQRLRGRPRSRLRHAVAVVRARHAPARART